MITTHEEAKELCKVFGINPLEHPDMVVTATGNIYLTDNVDPKDLGKQFKFNEEPEKEKETPKKASKKN